MDSLVDQDFAPEVHRVAEELKVEDFLSGEEKKESGAGTDDEIEDTLKSLENSKYGVSAGSSSQLSEFTRRMTLFKMNRRHTSLSLSRNNTLA